MDGYNGYPNDNDGNTRQFIPQNESGNAQGFTYQGTSQNNTQGYVSNQQQIPNGSYPGYGAPQNGDEPGKGAAIASLVLGIISIVFWFFGMGAFIGLVTGLIGVICASSSKKAGYTGGIQTGGLVCSIIGLIGSAVVFVACIACVGALGTAGALFG